MLLNFLLKQTLKYHHVFLDHYDFFHKIIIYSRNISPFYLKTLRLFSQPNATFVSKNSDFILKQIMILFSKYYNFFLKNITT